MAKRVVGPVSWFGGPNDSMDSGRTASGGTTATPGVAIRPGATYESGRATLGGYWRITDPKTGKSVVLKQTDIGPNQSTGRRIDVTYSALKKFGYSERNFPTDANWHAEYLGRSPGARTGSIRSTGAVTGSAGGSDLQAQARRQAAAQWLLSSSKSTADLQNRVSRAEAAVPATQTVTPKGPTTVRAPGQSTPLATVAKARADQIDAKKLPYQWGGGHGGKVDPAKATPLDCSGAVSAVLGINPRVSGDFQRWGRPGPAPGGKGITVYSNSHHVLMEIDGHFYGTSASNPGGGAGWIPRSQISPAYLAGFTARHSAR